MGLVAVTTTIGSLPAGVAVLFKRHLSPLSLLFLGYLSAVFYIVAIAASDPFASHSTFLLGKDLKGNIAWWGRLLFWPYHVGLRSKLWIQSLLSSEDSYNEIVPGWYLGGWPSEVKFVPPGSPAIVDVTCELPVIHRDLPHLNLLVWDTKGPTIDQIDQGVDWALTQREERPVLFHCAHGHGRSNVLMCATLLKLGKAGNIDEAVAQVQRARPRAKLNRSQRAALESWYSTTSKKN